MIKKLTPLGDGLGVIVEQPLLDLLGIDQDTPLELRTDGQVLILRPAQGSRRERLRSATKRMMEHHAETLRKLAL